LKLLLTIINLIIKDGVSSMKNNLLLGLSCMAMFALTGCQALDGALAKTGSMLDHTGDVLSGDFRGLGAAKQATLTEIWTDWQQNEVTAKDKWDSQRITVPGVITRITKTGAIVSQNQIAVIFRDPTNSKCTGQGLLRDDLLVNANKIKNLKVGDRISVTGVLGTTASKWSDQKSCWFSFDKAEIVKS
jgi:hypothetical protein